MPQAQGSSGILSWKPEKTFGVPNFSAVSGGANTTLSAAVNAGATSITVASATNIAAGDILKVGNDDSAEYVKVDSSYTTGTTIPLDSGTPINFRHEGGEAVVEVSPGGFKQLGAITAFTPGGEIGQFESAAIANSRKGLKSVRSGNYNVSGTIAVEASIEAVGILMLHVMNSDYAQTGTTVSGGGNTTLSSAASAGATTLSVASETNFAAGDYAQIGTGDGAEVVKIGSVSVGQLTLDSTAHPGGLRKAHASGEAVVEVTSPYTYTIKRGTLPAGLTLLVHRSDITDLALYRGVKINQMTLNVAAGGLPTLTFDFIAKAVQTLQANLFGTATSVSHTPYAPWEGKIDEGGAEITTVETFNLTVANNLRTDAFRIGSRFIQSAAEGPGRANGSLTYQYFDASLIKKTMFETESSLKLTFTYTGDSNHSLEFFLPKVKYSGTPDPGLPDSGPIADTRNFNALYDSTNDTDLKITYKTTEPQIDA